jgi:benzoate-CoA ligase family protein
MAEAVAAAAAIEIPDQFNAASWLVDSHVAQGLGGRTAILYEGQEITYAQVAENANRFGNALRRLGVGIEQRVLLLLLDSPEFVYAFFGAMKIGAVPIPTNTNLRVEDYEYLLADSRATVLVVSEPLLPLVAGLPRDRLGHLRHVIVAERAPGSGVPAIFEGQLSFWALLTTSSPDLETEPTSKDDAAFWLYSSGTTGFPKGAVHLHHDMVYCAEYYARGVLGIAADDRTFSVAKLFFAYGLGNALYFPFSVGAATILYPGRPEPARIFEVVQRSQPTLFFSVPTSYAQCLAAEAGGTLAAEPDLSSVRLCVSAGEALPRAIYERWLERFGVEILDGIGSTEILHIFISNRAGAVRPGSSGQLVPGYEAQVLDEDGNPTPAREIGNLLIKGDSTCAYYWNKHGRTKETILGEWIRTGDKYWVDDEGYYWYAGRADDMLKVGGQWVSPVEIENTLVEHERVLEVGVIGATDADGLTKPRAFVVLRPGEEPSPDLAEELKDFVKSRIAPFKYPRWIEFVPELPKTATGKTQRFRLRQLGQPQEEP